METCFKLVQEPVGPRERPAALFAALGSRHRLRILALLHEHGTLHAAAFMERLGLAQSTVSQHLTVLRDAELVSFEREGPRHVYRLRPEALVELRCAVDGLAGS